MQIFNGVLRFRKLLQVAIEGFCAAEGGLYGQRDSPLFEVALYLTLVSQTDIGSEGCGRLLKSLSRADTKKVLHLLRYTWDADNMSTWIKDEWDKIYDRTYINDQILRPAEEHWPAMEQLLGELDTTVVGKLPARRPAATTTAKPFNLTAPKARKVLMPQPVPDKPKHTPVPLTTYRAPIETEALERRRRATRAKQLRRDKAAASSPRLAQLSTQTRSERFYNLKEDLAYVDLLPRRRPCYLPATTNLSTTQAHQSHPSPLEGFSCSPIAPIAT
jgi:hypothetical protein